MVVLLTQSVDSENRSWSLLLLEIVYLILNNESPSQLWKEFIKTSSIIMKQFPNATVRNFPSFSKSVSSYANQEEELQGELAARARVAVKQAVGSSELSAILAEEKRKRSVPGGSAPLTPTRHPRWGGVFRQTDKVCFFPLLFSFSFLST